MNPRLAELVRLNGYKFNLLFGITCLFVTPYIVPHINIHAPGIVVGLLGLVMYVGDAWAFYYKTRITKVRVVYEMAGGDADKKTEPLPKLPWWVNYGFLVRFCFRMIFLIAALHAFGLMSDEQKDINGFALTILIIGALFELFLIAVTMISSGEGTEEEGKQSRKAGRQARAHEVLCLEPPRPWP